MTTNILLDRIERLERRVQHQRLIGMAALAIAGLFLLSGFAGRHDTILRAQGLVIEDAQGRPRLLIGAPVPAVAGRRRTDPASGVVLLDTMGLDRVALGAYGGPQINGKVLSRNSPAQGLVLNDRGGNERGGFALADNGTINLGLDTPDGREISLADVQRMEAMTPGSSAIYPETTHRFEGYRWVLEHPDVSVDFFRAHLSTDRSLATD